MGDYRITVTTEELKHLRQAYSLLNGCLGRNPRMDHFEILYNFGDAIIDMQDQALEAATKKENK